MNSVQKAQLRLEERRRELSQLLDVETRGEDFGDKLVVAKAAIDAAQLEVQAAGLVEPDVTETRTETRTDTEGDAYRELRSKVDFGRYVQGALTGGGITHGRGAGTEPAPWHSGEPVSAGTVGGAAGDEGKARWRRGGKSGNLA